MTHYWNCGTTCRVLLILGIFSALCTQAGEATAQEESGGSALLKRAIARAKGGSAGGPRKILGGMNADWHKHQWQVALLAAGVQDQLSAFFCGGVLVRPNWVVTAAHCVDEGTTPRQVQVLSGTDTLGSGRSPGEVELILVHKDFNRPLRHDHDIALLRLKGNAVGSPAQMIAPAEDGAFTAAGRRGIISGWGETDDSLASPRLQEARVPIVAQRTCNGPGSYDGRIGETMLCAGYDQGTRDACGGDSGGPLTVDGRLVGLMSWGDGCGQPFRYGVYARVVKLHGWITRCMNDPATCN